MRHVIRPDLTLVPDRDADPTADVAEGVPAPLRRSETRSRTSAKAQETQAFAPPPAVPSWARASGRAGRRSAVLRRRRPRPSRRASALRPARRRGAARPPGASERRGLGKNPAPQRRCGCAARPALRRWRHARACGEAAQAVARARRATACARRWPDPGRSGRARPSRGQRRCPRGKSAPSSARAGDPVSAAAKTAAAAFSAFPDAPAAEAEILALWVFDIVIAIRLRWPRPLPLIATRILDPSLRSDGRGRARPGEPAWEKHAATAVALAAASALDLAANLSRRSETLIAVAPKLRAKPAQRIVELLLAEDCVSPAEAARHAPMTDRAARRLFDRLVRLGAARELSGRPAFRLYGL